MLKRHHLTTVVATIVATSLLACIFMLFNNSSHAAEIENKVSATAEVKDESSIVSIYDESCNALYSEDNLKNKYEDLLVISYCQVAELYMQGEIPEKWYFLQREPFIEAADQLPKATDEEILEGYKSLLMYLFDTMTEDEVSGYDIDQDLYNFVINEIGLYNVEL